jgi:hypothetical protein
MELFRFNFMLIYALVYHTYKKTSSYNMEIATGTRVFINPLMSILLHAASVFQL